jgi:chaperonin GroEL
MILKDNLFVGEEARTKLMAGVSKAAQAVAVTLGTAGSNSLIEAIENPGHFSTNDGATILEKIEFADPLEEMGRSVLAEAVSRANKSSGDGSSSTAVLCAAILEEGMKHIGEVSPMEIKRSLEACIPIIEASIVSQKKDITVDTVAQVASISAEDEGIGAMIQEIYQKIGKDGIIQWDISKTAEDSYTIGTGLTVHGATYVASYMCDEDTSEVRLTNPLILLARKKITTALDFETLFPVLFAREIKEIVIFCDEIEVSVIADLFKTQKIRGFKTVVIKMPTLWKDEWWEDLALASGGTLIDINSGIKLNEATFEHLGKFEHMTVTKEATYIDGIQDLKKHILSLQVEGSNQSLVRAGRLNTRTARYFVGAHSESALAYRRLKTEDAINAASCALANGIVPGGGIALLNASGKLSEEDNGIGATILQDALFKPLEQIIINAGKDVDKIFKKMHVGTPTEGFNSRTGEIVDMFDAGIVDPTDVVIGAITNAIGVAAMILTTSTVVTLPKEDQPQTPQMPMMR